MWELHHNNHDSNGRSWSENYNIDRNGIRSSSSYGFANAGIRNANITSSSGAITLGNIDGIEMYSRVITAGGINGSRNNALCIGHNIITENDVIVTHNPEEQTYYPYNKQ